MTGKQLANYILKKIIKLFSVLFAVSLLSFLLVSFSPIDPIRSYVGADMANISPEQREQINEYWGIDEPKYEQFINWGSNVLNGELGFSRIYRMPVSQIIAERFLSSVTLMGLAWLLSGLFGLILGIVAAMKQNSWLDHLIRTYCYTLASTPTFWLGLLLLMLFSVQLGWFPIGLGTPAGELIENVTIGQRIKHLLLPAFTLSIVGVSNIALHTRQKLIDVLDSDYIRYAKAKGKSGVSLVLQHGLRHISLPMVTLSFASFGEIFGGAVLAEQIFSYPGLGQAVVQAGLGGDVPLLLGIVLFSTLFVFIGNLIADLLYQVIDPRIRRGEIG